MIVAESLGFWYWDGGLGGVIWWATDCQGVRVNFVGNMAGRPSECKSCKSVFFAQIIKIERSCRRRNSSTIFSAQKCRKSN